MQIDLRTKKVYPNNNCPFPHMTIDDSGDMARKIRQGYAFDLKNDKIILGAKTGPDLEDITEKLRQGRANNQEMQQAIHYLLTN